jgi:hypothetical protein
MVAIVAALFLFTTGIVFSVSRRDWTPVFIMGAAAVAIARS